MNEEKQYKVLILSSTQHEDVKKEWSSNFDKYADNFWMKNVDELLLALIANEIYEDFNYLKNFNFEFYIKELNEKLETEIEKYSVKIDIKINKE